MMPWVSGLAAGFPLALVLAAARSLLSGQTIGGRGLGRVCGVPLAQGELSFQVGDLLFLFGDLLAEVRTIQVESWLRGLPLAKSSCAKIRNLMSVLFNHACRYELFDRNPIYLVRH